MEGKTQNRIKVILAEKNLQSKWLAEQLGVSQAKISKWVTNSAQPNIDMFLKISKCLGVTMEELVRTPQEDYK